MTTNESTEPNVEDAVFLNDLAKRLFQKATPAMGFDQGDTDQLYRIARSLGSKSPQPATSREAVIGLIRAEMMSGDYPVSEWGQSFADKILSLTPAPAAGVEIPEGYALAPIEPTEAMITSCLDVEHNYNHWRWASKIWRAMLAASPAPADVRPSNTAQPVEGKRKFQIGDRVTKTKGSSWTGLVVGSYSTSLTPEGYAVESENEPGSVQIYPASALASKGGVLSAPLAGEG